jgi:hypothetical protein
MKQIQITDKQIAALLSLLVIGGLLMHDIKINSITSVAALSVVSTAGYGALSNYHFDSGDHHIHVSNLLTNASSSLRTGLPKVPTKSDNDKKYVTHKRFASGNGNNGESYWPSI